MKRVTKNYKLKTVFLLFILLMMALPAWASTINLPRTGQTKCYDSAGTEIACTGTGQDGAIQAGVAWPSPRFTDNGDQTITDNLTGLVWTKDAGTPTAGSCTGGTKAWQDALNYVACLNTNNYLGHSDWRLPNVNELRSLIDYSKSSPVLPEGHPFLNVQSGGYWLSSTIAFYTVYAWYVDMYYYGYVSGGYKSVVIYYVWPVRAGQCGTFGNSVICLPKTGQTTSYATGDDGDLQTGVTWPNPRFIDNSNGTVTDNLTGLMWTKDANLSASTKTWQGAIDYVKGMNAGTYTNYGHTDWRLPNINELESLVDSSKYSPTLPEGHPFLNVQSLYYWSSSTCDYNTDHARYVDMNVGYVDVGGKSGDGYMWPVRAGQSSITLTLTPPSTTTVSKGGVLGPFSVSMTNNTSSSYSIIVAPYLYTSDGNWINIGYIPITISANSTHSANILYLPIPSFALTGTYYYWISIYDTSWNTLDYDYFTFTVTSSSSPTPKFGNESQDWRMSGWNDK